MQGITAVPTATPMAVPVAVPRVVAGPLGWPCPVSPPIPATFRLRVSVCSGSGLVGLSWVLPSRSGIATTGVISSLGSQIKRFLKEDSDEAELTQFLRDCPPADSSRKVEAPEGRREPGHPLGSAARVPPEEGNDERDARIFSRSRPPDFQQHIAAPPPPSPNRPRSPWGQLDPYDSSEVQDVSVGKGGTHTWGKGLRDGGCFHLVNTKASGRHGLIP